MMEHVEDTDKLDTELKNAISRRSVTSKPLLLGTKATG